MKSTKYTWKPGAGRIYSIPQTADVHTLGSDMVIWDDATASIHLYPVQGMCFGISKTPKMKV